MHSLRIATSVLVFLTAAIPFGKVRGAQVFLGSDINSSGDPTIKISPTPQSDAAKASFFSLLSNPQTENFGAIANNSEDYITKVGFYSTTSRSSFFGIDDLTIDAKLFLPGSHVIQ